MRRLCTVNQEANTHREGEFEALLKQGLTSPQRRDEAAVEALFFRGNRNGTALEDLAQKLDLKVCGRSGEAD